MVDQGLLQADQFHTAIGRLAQANYHYVSLRPATLVHTLEAQSWHASGEAERVFRVLQGPDTSAEAAAEILAQCVRDVWIRPILWEQKCMILDLCLQTLLAGRSMLRVLPLFHHGLRQRMNLLPFHLSEVEAQIHLWLQARRLAGPPSTLLN